MVRDTVVVMKKNQDTLPITLVNIYQLLFNLNYCHFDYRACPEFWAKKFLVKSTIKNFALSFEK